jgi:hypothetical protein
MQRDFKEMQGIKNLQNSTDVTSRVAKKKNVLYAII